MATLPDVLRAELARCQTLARDYAELGTAGAFASALLANSLHEAEQALRQNDAEAIQRALNHLRSFRDVMPEGRRVAPVARHPPASPMMVTGPKHRSVVPMPARIPPQPALHEQFFTWTRAAA
jgi:hypothetical protein